MSNDNWWVEVWDHPAVGTTKHISRLRVYSARGRRRLSGVGQGQIVIDADQVPDVVDDGAGAKMIRIVHDGREKFAFIAEQAIADITDQNRARVFGPDLMGALADGAIRPFDDPAAGALSEEPDWTWGGVATGGNVLQNPGFEDGLLVGGVKQFTHWQVINPGGEDEPTRLGGLLWTPPDADIVEEGDWALVINPRSGTDWTSGYGTGIEQIAAVSPGTWQASLRARNFATSLEWTLQVLDLEDNVIPSASGIDQKSTPSATWTTYSITDLAIPAGVTHVKFQFVFSDGTGNPTPMWIDSCVLEGGAAAATYGQILLELLTPIKARGALTWVDTASFSASVDAEAAAWADAALGFKIAAGTANGFFDAIRIGAGYGYETILEPFDDTDPTAGYRLLPYNPGGAGEDLTTDASRALLGPPLRGAIPTRATLALPPKNAVYVLAADGSWDEATDAGDITNHGRREWVIRNNELADVASAEAHADAQLANQGTATRGVTAKLTGDHTVQPGVEISLGDQTIVDYSPTVGRSNLRVVGYQGTFDDRGIVWDLDTNRLVWSTPEAPTEVLLRLARQNRPTGAALAPQAVISDLITDANGLPYLVVAAADAPTLIKERADYVCTGTRDHLTIQDAIDWWDGKGFGGVWLTGGLYDLTPAAADPEPILELNPGVNDGCVVLRGVGAHDLAPTSTGEDDFGTYTGTKLHIADNLATPNADDIPGAIRVLNAIVRDITITGTGGSPAYKAAIYAQNDTSLYNVGIDTTHQFALNVSGAQASSRFHQLYLAADEACINIANATGSMFTDLRLDIPDVGIDTKALNGTADRIAPVYGCQFRGIYAKSAGGTENYLLAARTPNDTAAWPSGDAFEANLLADVTIASDVTLTALVWAESAEAWLGPNTIDLSSIHDGASSALFAGAAIGAPFYTSKTAATATADLPNPALVPGEIRFDTNQGTLVRSDGSGWVAIGAAAAGGTQTIVAVAGSTAHTAAAATLTNV